MFSSNRWKLHPDWVYCEYNFAESDDREFEDTPENNMRHFLDRLSHEGVGFDWGNSTAAGKKSHFCEYLNVSKVISLNCCQNVDF